MKNQRLVIVDLENDKKIDYNNVNYVLLNKGKIFFKDSKRIFLSNLRNKSFETLKKRLIKKLILKVNKGTNTVNFFPELDFFNIRNDRDKSIDLILNLLILKQFIKKNKFTSIDVVTDNELTKDFFLNKKNNIIFKNSSILKKYSFYKLKILKFYIKSLFIILISKLFGKRKNSNNEACITFYPFFFKNGKDTFFEKEKSLKINFLLADETQLNYSFFDIFNLLINNKTNNLVNIESYISVFDIINSYLKSFYYLRLVKKNNFDFTIGNYNFKKFYKEKIFSSLLNRSKLLLYDNAIKKCIDANKVKKINLYLFEYNFGFYFIKNVRKNCQNIEISGYQHGIFYKNLLWFEIISKIKLLKDYQPNKVISFNKNIINDYKSFYKKNNKIKYIIREKKVSEVSKKIKFKKTNNILVLTGTHDAEEIVKEIYDKKKFLKKDKFNYYIKFHPKKKMILKKHNEIHSINKIEKIKFDKVVISPTSTLVYDMMKLKKPFYIFEIDYKLNYVLKIPKFK